MTHTVQLAYISRFLNFIETLELICPLTDNVIEM